MKILLTGGAGYIGSHTAAALLDSGHEISVVDNFSNSSPEAVQRVGEITGARVNIIEKNNEIFDDADDSQGKDRDNLRISLYEADVTDKNRMSEILKKEMPECIIHFAGLKAVGESVEKPVEYYRNNIDTTLTLLECMRELGLSNIVFSSSATVYGEGHKPPFTEEMAKGVCTNPYGWTKWMQEQILSDAAAASEREAKADSVKEASSSANLAKEGDASKKAKWNRPLSVVLLRYFNPVGAHQSGLIGEDPKGIPNNLMPYISQVAVGRRKQLTVFGDDYDTPDGTCRRDYIHVMDLAEGHVKAAEYASSHSGTEVFNLGTGTPCSVLDMIKAFEKACGHAIDYKMGPRRAGDVQDSWADAAKAREVLGWEAKRGIEEICRDAWHWQSRNPNGYL